MSRQLSQNRFLADLFSKDPTQANFLQEIIRSINNVAAGAGVAVSGDTTPPPPVNALTVKASGEMLHVTLSHAAQVSRSVEYYVEAHTDPSFTAPAVIEHFGPSRSKFMHLPTYGDSLPGGAPPPINKWYLRAYAQYPGSKPSAPTVLGGLNNPTPIVLTGTTKLSPLPSTGSGTASSTGQQGGSGRGKQRISTPKVVRIGKSQASQTPVVLPVLNPPIHLLAAVNSASGTTSVSQSGTSTAINVASSTFYIGDLTLVTNPGSVDPGSYGTWFVFHDDPNLQGGNVTYQVTSDVTVLGRSYSRFVDGKITTSGAGGGSGGGSGGGGGGRGFL